MIFWSGLFLSFGVVEKKNISLFPFSFLSRLFPIFYSSDSAPVVHVDVRLGFCTWLIFLVPIKLLFSRI